MKTYRLSPSGRRTALILLVGALIIWAFALWTFRSTLGISYNPALFWSSLRAAIQGDNGQGLSISQIVPALLMLVLIIATPLVIWNILEEWAATYTPTDDGLRFDSLGVAVTYPWDGIGAVRGVDEDSDEPMDELLLREDYTRQIRNPLLRFLHGQAYGRRKLPLYAGLQDRDELLVEIRRRAGLAEGIEEREQGTGDREQGTGDREQGTGDREQGTGDREQGTGDREQGTGDRGQGTGDRAQRTGDRGQEAGDKEQGTESITHSP